MPKPITTTSLKQHFCILPGVVPANQTSTVRILPQRGHSLDELGDFSVYYRAHENRLAGGVITADIVPHPQPEWHIENGTVVITCFFAEEQEHTFNLIQKGTEERPEILMPFRVYSLHQDLWGLKPFRGNFHQHSTNSPCCHAEEDCPAHVLAESRRIGLDFTTITDHNYYDSIAEAMATYDKVPLDLLTVPGEEVHPMQWSQHIVNFGGSRSIIRMIEADRPRFDREVEAIRQDLSLPDTMDWFVICATQWAFARIREAGGLAILAHPYWYYYRLAGLMTSPEVTEKLLELRGFDAMEVASGFNYDIAEYNNWQQARWFALEAQGQHIPPLGVNDSHRCRGKESVFTWYSTVVLARDLTFEGIKNAVRACHCGAMERLPHAPVKFYASLRLIKYFHFLWREYFPLHDRLCQREGLAMEDYRKGNHNATQKLSRYKGQTHRWQKQFMGQLFETDVP